MEVRTPFLGGKGMGLFGGQFASVIEWEEFRDDVIFWKWKNSEIRKKSRLIIKPGQSAVFLYNGRLEGIFTDEGDYEVASQIVPFLSSLKGFKFGFNSGIRAEVLFVNKKEFTMTWGTKNAIMVPFDTMPGGIPIRCFGTYVMKVDDLVAMIDNLAGVREIYTVEDVKLRVDSMLDQLLMKWIAQEGRDLFHLQSNADAIGQGICTDLDMELIKIGLTVSNFKISSFSYPKDIQDKINASASESILNPDKEKPKNSSSAGAKYCSNCGAPLAADAKFCGNCGKMVG